MTDLMDSCVELVEKERECLFALQGGARKQVAIPQTKLHLNRRQFSTLGLRSRIHEYVFGPQVEGNLSLLV